MATNDDEPKLVELGANTRDAPSGVNLDVSGTVGPDHLGQETVDVDGHPCDRPGVRSRLPEQSSTVQRGPEGEEVVDPRVQRMDTGEDLPVLLSSNMSADPCEGVQGSYTQIVEGECVRCGYDRLKVTVATLPGEHQESCMACGAKQGRRYDDGYRMPTTEKERTRKERESGQKLGSLTTNDVYDMEPDTGYGPYISLVCDRGRTRIRKDDVEALFWMLVSNDDIDLSDTLDSNLRGMEKARVGLDLLPDDVGIAVAEDDEEPDDE